ncbi:hypothetical protein BC831DRAFT_503324 [Entophlyctis helioformis]|nr:hypothetical protein BC831DRAFT_503324 [Entophlyctis helioformis]
MQVSALFSSVVLVAAAVMQSVSAQAPALPVVPPATCTQCSTVATSISSCRLADAAPASQAEWSDVGSKLATCMCPFFRTPAADACSICIQGAEPDSPSTKLFFQLKEDCFNNKTGATAADIVSVWNVTIAVVAPPAPPSASLAVPTAPRPTSTSTSSAIVATGAVGLASFVGALLAVAASL